MKLSARDAKAYFAKPDPAKAGLLIYGPDAMRISLKRKEVVDALVGPDAEQEMRLTRISGSELRKDPALLLDALKAQGFFPGPRAVVIDQAGDGTSEAIKSALSEWRDGDAVLVATAGQLTPRSSLRKLFEAQPSAYAAPVYDDPLDRGEIERELKKAGLGAVDQNAMNDLFSLGQSLDLGDFRQMLEKLALYKIGDSEPVTSEDIEASAPATLEAALDDALDCAAEGRVQELGPILRRIESQGIAPVRLCIGAAQHFQRLYQAASNPNGPDAGLSQTRPPVPFKRKDRMARQAKSWGAARLETALTILTETDLTLRSSSQMPPMAAVERALIRLAMLAQR